MDLDFSDEDVEVRCKCGAHWTVARTGAEDFITCNNCGSRVTLHTIAVAPDSPRAATTIFHAPKVAPTRDPKSQRAVELVREEKFDEAITQYEEILSRQPTYRDVFYGLGFCFYKTEKLHEAQVLLRIAHDMGHPNAEKLLNKTLAKITMTEGDGP